MYCGTSCQEVRQHHLYSKNLQKYLSGDLPGIIIFHKQLIIRFRKDQFFQYIISFVLLPHHYVSRHDFL